MKKFLKLKNVVIFMASLLSLGSMVACGQNNSAVPYAPFVAGPAVNCLPGQAGCTYANPATWPTTCAEQGGNISTSTDGTAVCAVPIQQTWEFQGTQDYMGPSGGAGIGVGVLYPGDAVTLNASGSWGTNTCNWNFCTSWSGCSCSCKGGTDVSDASSGLYGQIAGLQFQISSGASFQVGATASPYGSELYVGFNAGGSGMTCYGVTINAQVTRCYDINGLTHPCTQGQ